MPGVTKKYFWTNNQGLPPFYNLLLTHLGMIEEASFWLPNSYTLGSPRMKAGRWEGPGVHTSRPDKDPPGWGGVFQR